MSNHRSTRKGVESHVVVSRRSQTGEMPAWWKQAMEINRATVAKAVENAKGRTIVRQSAHYLDSCIWLGDLVRETKHYYVFEPSEHAFPFTNKTRIRKEKAHIEPCKCCIDHPEYDPQNLLS